MLDRYKGCLLALAIGDALGSPIQFKKRDTYIHIFAYTTGGCFKSKKGEYTDDTSMALCLAESLINSNGFDAKNQLDTYVKWLKYGYMSTRPQAYDIGLTVRNSLEFYIKTSKTTTYLNKERDSGNGSLMRLAPVVMYYASNMDNAVTFSAKSSLTTHASTIAVDTCRYFAYILTLILNGVNKSELFDDKASEKMKNYFIDKPLHSEIAKIANGSYKNKCRDDIKSSGYAAHTLEASLWVFYNGTTFKETILAAVNLGDDADTVGAVAGQLAGAYYGYSSIDTIFLDDLFNKELILDMAEKLFKNKN